MSQAPRDPKKTLVLEVIIILICLVVLAPLVMVLLGSLKTPAEAAQFNLSLPSEWHFENYLEIFRKTNALRAIKNSLTITLSVVLVCVLVGTPCAYYIARKKSRYANGLRLYFNLGIIVPLSIVPSIFLLQTLGIMGTPMGLVCIYLGMRIPWIIFLCVGFIKGIPMELEEAALIDGCGGALGPLKVFFRIIFPLLKPILITAVIIITMGVWNEFQLPLYFLSSSKNTTLPMTVYWFYGQYQTSWNLVFANLVVTALPIILLYLYCQKYVIAGMTQGAVKS